MHLRTGNYWLWETMSLHSMSTWSCLVTRSLFETTSFGDRSDTDGTDLSHVFGQQAGQYHTRLWVEFLDGTGHFL